MWITLLAATIVMFLLAAGFAGALSIARNKLHVEVDPRQEKIEAILPQANCGACGYPGCAAFAEAVAAGKAPVTGCIVGGPDLAQRIAEIMGVEAGDMVPRRPVVRCSATSDVNVRRPPLARIETCAEAHAAGQTYGCAYGCLGLADCVRACPFGAMKMENGLPVIDYEVCTGCGICAKSCPRGIIELIPLKFDRMFFVACSSRDPGRVTRQICPVGCIGCGACVRACSIFKLENNLASIDYEQYEDTEGLLTAAGKCPTKVIKFVDRKSSRPQAAQAQPANLTASAAS